MKKIFAASFLLFSIFFKSFGASPADRVIETHIENGLTVFSLEDYSNPQVRVELCIRAGFSNQTVADSGFFILLSRLIEKSSRLSFDSVNVGADSTNFILTVSPDEISNSLCDLSESVFNSNFSDSLLESEWTNLKREVLNLAGDSGTFINAGIDSRVFSSEPWRNDSGIYPALFSKLNESEVRKKITSIQEKFFSPSNAAIFVSGNIEQENVIKNIDESFGRYYSNKISNYRPLVITGKGQKKFVMHSTEFSDELTQIVVQYENLTEEECLLASEIYNDEFSMLKQTICNSDELNIPGAEYVHFSSAVKTGSSRLIIQSLLQNSKIMNPAEQTAEFLSLLKTKNTILFEDFNSAVARNCFTLSRQISSSSGFMSALSEMWCKDPYLSDASPIIEKVKNRKNEIQNVSSERIISVLENDEPFVFVILNTKKFQKYKKEFKNFGFSEINSANASWYTNTLYKNVKTLEELSNLTENKENKNQNVKSDFAENFLKQNETSLSTITLKNGIPVFLKQNNQTTGVTLLLSISGGNIRNPENYGFEEVMTNILCTNILRQIRYRQYEGLILNDFNISSETLMDSSRIIIECETEDFYSIINAVANSLIMDEVVPTDADRIVQGRRTRKRLENGSVTNQMFSASVNSIFSNDLYKKIFDTQNEILEDITYEKILQNYPSLLQPERYTLILSGNFDSSVLQTTISDSFSLLKKNEDEKSSLEKKVEIKKNFPKGKQKKVKLVHTFLTDIPAKDAGPMPAVLIPTKSFADPVIFCADAPDSDSEDFFVLNAILPYLQEKLNTSVSGKIYLNNCKVTAAEATALIPVVTFTFSSVEKISSCDLLYKEILADFKNSLTNITNSARTLQNVKTKYIAKEFSEAYTNTGSAILIEESLREKNEDSPLFYLEKYRMTQELDAEKILKVIEKYLEFENLFRLYSSDSK